MSNEPRILKECKPGQTVITPKFAIVEVMEPTDSGYIKVKHQTTGAEEELHGNCKIRICEIQKEKGESNDK